MKREDIRRIDEVAIRDFGMSGLVLMENAGRGASERICARYSANQPVTVLCGRGNNGGDGYVIARHLQLANFAVSVVSVVPLDRLTGDARANAQIAIAAEIPIREVNDRSELAFAIQADSLIVDCLLGTGASGAPRGPYRDAIELANSVTGPRVAIDLPSGLDCDSGTPQDPTFRADVTITFVAMKDGFGNSNAAAFTGEVEVVPIGVPQKLLSRFGL